MEAQMANDDSMNRTDLVTLSRFRTDLPPFWELEQLLVEGSDLAAALDELARRQQIRFCEGRAPCRTVLSQDEPSPGILFTFTP